MDISYYLNNISLVTYLVVFAGGLATSFTPCVYPLIPIIVGVIGASSEVSKLRAFIMSLSYVIGMAMTFSALGMIAALTGRLFGEMQSSPLAHIIVGNVIIFFALVLLDVVQIPVFLLNRAGAGKVVKGGNAVSAFLMGIASGFIAAPCTAAVLGALLTYVASTQNLILGSTFLFVFALGLGTVLIIIGSFTGVLASFSRSEGVMRAVQKVFAFLMIFLGEYFIFKAGFLSI